jgi:starch synthase
MAPSLYAPNRVKRVWILTFEFSSIVKVGGLGEAVSIIAHELSKRGLEAAVIMPSHGVRPQGFKEVGTSCSGVRYGADGREYSYDLTLIEGYVGGVKVVLIGGKPGGPQQPVDVWPPYSYIEEKACLLARAVRCLAQKYGYPDLVHANDWHAALAASVLKVDAEQHGYALPVLYQIHLRGSPSYPWHYGSEHWCGLPNSQQRVWAVTRHVLEGTQSLWDSCWGNIECFAVKTADAVATVSRSELELLARDYGEFIRGKACYSYNSTSWSLKEVEDIALRLFNTCRRDEIRWRVLGEALRSSPSWGHVELGDGEVLVVASGRLTPQKGFDVLLQAAAYLPSSTKVVILGRRVGDEGYESYLRNLLNYSWGRSAVVYGDIDQRLYKLLVYASHVYALPSRYEPFGISAVEALAVGTPVVVSDLGGLREYVGDLRLTPLGVGLRVPPNNVHELAVAIQSLGYLMRYSESGRGLDMVALGDLKGIALREPKFGEKLRSIATAYVDMFFRPEHTVNSVLACYELARQMAYYRALTC